VWGGGGPREPPEPKPETEEQRDDDAEERTVEKRQVVDELVGRQSVGLARTSVAPIGDCEGFARASLGSCRRGGEWDRPVCASVPSMAAKTSFNLTQKEEKDG
jgi:hypothetical protein